MNRLNTCKIIYKDGTISDTVGLTDQEIADYQADETVAYVRQLNNNTREAADDC